MHRSESDQRVVLKKQDSENQGGADDDSATGEFIYPRYQIIRRVARETYLIIPVVLGMVVYAAFLLIEIATPGTELASRWWSNTQWIIYIAIGGLAGTRIARRLKTTYGRED